MTPNIAGTCLSVLSTSYDIQKTNFTTEKHVNFHCVDNMPDYILEVGDIINKVSLNVQTDWFRKVVEYNVKRDKYECLENTVSTYVSLMKGKQEIPNLPDAQIMGWSVEFLNTAVTIYCDFMEGNQWSLRQGKTCWHNVENVGIMALIDAIILENAIYLLIHKHFGNSDKYIQLVDSFHDAAEKRGCAEKSAVLYSKQPVMSFTMEMYRDITKSSTTSCLFELPFKLASILAGINNEDTCCQYEHIFNELSCLYQAQEDFLNLYGRREENKKNGTDIERNKRTWFVAECLQRGNHQQKEIMQECYGKQDPYKVQRVKKLYASLELYQAFRMFEDQTLQNIKTKIQQLDGLQQDIFLKYLNQIYLRTR
ncbi:uncharacterized protein [Musca autumnalis]|uniref:uncharacterized protein n=1 Tax=Musca autumnalis TaxID=221902 RepID=UPI003CFAC2EF